MRSTAGTAVSGHANRNLKAPEFRLEFLVLRRVFNELAGSATIATIGVPRHLFTTLMFAVVAILAVHVLGSNFFGRDTVLPNRVQLITAFRAGGGFRFHVHRVLGVD